MFQFLKYIQPLYYYRLLGQLSEESKDQYLSLIEGQKKDKLILDSQFYESESAKMDLLYQALQKGYIPDGIKKASSKHIFTSLKEITHIGDNYQFIAKYFGKGKLTYVFLLRILTLKNPVLEIGAYLRSLKRKKLNVFENHQVYDDFHTFNSDLIQENPLVSIVIPTLNRYEYLKDVLADLEKQDYQNFEVLICDQTDAVNEVFYEDWNLNIRLFKQEEKALWLARNTCIQKAQGEFVLLTEDDVLLPNDWITNHLKCLDFFKCDISAGVFYPEGKKMAINQSFFKLAYHLATGNVCFRKEVFNKIGLFDRQFEKQRMGDGEYGLRAMLNGLKSVSNPFAYCVDVKAPTGGLRQMGSWDSLRPTNIFAPRPVPSVLYLARKYFGNSAARYYLIQNIPFSFIPYKFKKSKVLKLLFLCVLPLFLPLMCVVVIKSWLKATKMLKSGALISTL
jgi:glycosyltransferase involved in cell wall biosynthesis